MLEVKIPDEIFGELNFGLIEREKFVLEAVKEKIEREKQTDSAALLAEGYRANRDEDAVLTKEFETAGSLRPFGLAAGEFVVPDDFDAPLPNEVLADFEGR